MTERVVRSVPFKFQLGDVTLFSITRQLAIRAIPLRDAIAMNGPLAVPSNYAQPGIDGYAVRGSPVSGNPPTIAPDGGFLRYIPLRYSHCYIDLATTFEQYQAKFSSKTRSTIKRKITKFAQTCGGTLQWKTYTKPEELDEFFTNARAVSKLTYQERLLDAGLPDSPNFRDSAASLATANNLRAYVLFDRNRPVSYLYCPIEDGVVVYAYLGYDPDYARLSVGTVLQWLALEALFMEGKFRLFDFTEGQSEHKRLFATHERECANIFWLNHTFPNQILVHAHETTNRFSSWLGCMLEGLGIKARIKRLLRRS